MIIGYLYLKHSHSMTLYVFDYIHNKLLEKQYILYFNKKEST